MMGHGDKQYRIKLVGEDDLPAEQDFAFIDCGGELWLALSRPRLSEQVLEEAWNLHLEMERRAYRATA